MPWSSSKHPPFYLLPNFLGRVFFFCVNTPCQVFLEYLISELHACVNKWLVSMVLWPCRRIPGACCPVKFWKIDPSVVQVHRILKFVLLQSKKIYNIYFSGQTSWPRVNHSSLTQYLLQNLCNVHCTQKRILHVTQNILYLSGIPESSLDMHLTRGCGERRREWGSAFLQLILKNTCSCPLHGCGKL